MKMKLLKFTFLILILALTSIPVAGQYLWSAPQPISDSVADNRNPLIIELQFNGTIDYFIFWERSVDPIATAIYYRRFYEAETPVALKEEANVHYRNPQIIPTNYLSEDTLFYFFYESDQNGNIDIYYQVYTTLGFGEPVLFVGSPEDDTNLRCLSNGLMVWMEGDKVRQSQLTKWNSPFYFTDPVTIDSINCSSPVISSDSYVAWLKSDSGNSSVYFSQPGGAPILLDSTGNNISLRFAMTTCSNWGAYGDVLVWENIIDGACTIMAHDFWNEDFIAGFSQPGPFMPDIALYMIPVNGILDESFMTFVNLEEGNGDIYATDWSLAMGISPNLEDYLNISNSPNIDTHPAFFNGRCIDYTCDLVDVWESFRNGHWQLFYSINGEIGCFGGMPEAKRQPDLKMEIYPNPARSACHVSFTLSEDSQISLNLITLEGKQVRLIDNKFFQKGEYSYQLDLNQVFSGVVPSGLMMLRLQTGSENLTKRIVRIH